MIGRPRNNSIAIRSVGPWVAAATFLFAAPLGGCDGRGGGEIRSYRVAKETPPGPVAAAPSGPRVAPGSTLEWDLPEGWVRSEEARPMRFATLLSGGADGETIEVAVSSLGGSAGGIVANINRWRGQVGLPAAGEAELAKDALPIDGRGARGVMVDLIGPGPEAEAPRMFATIFPAGGSTWFIKAMGPAAVLETHRGSFIALCESARFSGAPDASARSAPPPPGGAPMSTPSPVPGAGGDPGSTLPTFGELPAGWVIDATPRPMSVTSFTVIDGGAEASMTITPLAGNQDLLANVNRWRRQVGLGPLADLIESPPSPLEIDGRAGHLVDIAGPDSRTLGAVTTDGSMTWFFKLSGPDALVSSQREAFEAFVASIDIDGSAE